jgi:hypothetical protein
MRGKFRGQSARLIGPLSCDAIIFMTGRLHMGRIGTVLRTRESNRVGRAQRAAKIHACLNQRETPLSYGAISI